MSGKTAVSSKSPVLFSDIDTQRFLFRIAKPAMFSGDSASHELPAFPERRDWAKTYRMECDRRNFSWIAKMSTLAVVHNFMFYSINCGCFDIRTAQLDKEIDNQSGPCRSQEVSYVVRMEGSDIC